MFVMERMFKVKYFAIKKKHYQNRLFEFEVEIYGLIQKTRELSQTVPHLYELQWT